MEIPLKLGSQIWCGVSTPANWTDSGQGHSISKVQDTVHRPLRSADDLGNEEPVPSLRSQRTCRALQGLKLLDGVLALVPAGWCWKLETQGTRSPKTGLGQQSNPWGSLWARNGLKKQSAQERQIADDWIHNRNIGMVCKSLSWWSSNISGQALFPHLPPASGAWYLPPCMAENPPWRVEDHGTESHPYVYLARILICDAFIKWEDKRIRVRRNPTSWQQLARLTSFKFNYIYIILKIIMRYCAVYIYI